MEDPPKVSPIPTVRPGGPTSAVRTLGERAAAGESAAGESARGEVRPLFAESEQAEPSRAADAPARQPEPKEKLSLSLRPAAWLGACELPPARQGEPYPARTLEASGGAAPYRFSVVRAFTDLFDETRRLPPGLALSEDGVIGGTPTRGGSFRFTVEVRDASGKVGRAEYMIPVRLDLRRYRSYFDRPHAAIEQNFDRAISHFDPDETDADGQPLLPLSLCEFLAYKSAQAYMQDSPLDPKRSLRRHLQRTHPNGEITHFQFFDSNRPLKRFGGATLEKRATAPLDKAPELWSEFSAGKIDQLNEWRAGLDAQGFGFVFEGRVFIILRGSTSLRDWRVDIDHGLTTDPPRSNSWWENVKFRLGLRGKKVSLTENERILIGGPDPGRYLAPGRAIGFAAAWAALRDPIENWLTSVPEPFRREFVFSGHSLGGAMALIGAQEYAQHLGRRIHAVVTFGAPCVGRSAESDGAALMIGDHFVETYQRLQDGELARRTLRIETTSDAVPKLLHFKNFRPVGQAWEIEFEPLPGPTALFFRRYLSGPLLWLARGGLGYEVKGLADLPRKALGYAALYGIPFLSHAVGSHGAYRRYAGYLSTLSYRKIREARLGDVEDEATLEALEKQGPAALDRYFLANALYDQHLRRIYAPPELRAVAPRYIRDPAEEKRLAQRYYCAERAKFLF